MGLKPKEVKSLLLKDFDLMLIGHNRRIQRQTQQTRNIMAFIKAFSFGSTQFTAPEDLLPLPIDNEYKKQMITTLSQAKQLFKEFM